MSKKKESIQVQRLVRRNNWYLEGNLTSHWTCVTWKWLSDIVILIELEWMNTLFSFIATHSGHKHYYFLLEFVLYYNWLSYYTLLSLAKKD